MKKIWKILLAAGCALSMVMTVPGMSVLAEELQEKMVVSATEDLEQELKTAEFTDEGEVAEDVLVDENIFIDEKANDRIADEETVGGRECTVGDGVKATFDEKTGAVTFYSNGGTLWRRWGSELGVDRFKVKSIKVGSGKVYLPEDCSGELDFSTSYMFEFYINLEELDLSGFDTSKVTDMERMFRGCSSLKSLNLSGFNTSNVTDMSEMFCSCSNLTELDVSGLDTSNVTDMNGMFLGCSGLKKLNLGSINTSAVTDMGAMFQDCGQLRNLDVSSIDTSNVTSMSRMFDTCSNLTKLDLSNFVTSKVLSMHEMFDGCTQIQSLDLGSFDTSNVTGMALMFSECKSLISLNLSSFNTLNVIGMDEMFCDCKNLRELDMSSFDISNVESADWMLSGCSSLELIKTPRNNTQSVKLPMNMYDESEKMYTELPQISESIILKRKTEGFSDVQDPNHAFYKAIYWAADAGITKGYPDGTFGIDRSCTRGEMIMFLWRYAGKPAPKAVSKSPFKDVAKSHAFYKAILWASQKGITKGYPDGTFGINRNVSRGECMMFLWRLKGKPAPKAVSVSPFKDVPKNHAFYNAILWGYQKKITNGYTSGAKKGTFGINENCTRGAIVTFLYRAK